MLLSLNFRKTAFIISQTDFVMLFVTDLTPSPTDGLPLVMSEPLLMEANRALRQSGEESLPPELMSREGGGGPGGGGGGQPPAGARGAAEAEAGGP